MAQARLNLRAVIFDIYTTILEVGPPPARADARWEQLFSHTLGGPPPFTRTEFAVRTSRVVARQHAAARGRGIPYPEILWPSVVLEVIPGLTRLSAPQQDAFVYEQMQLGRTLRLADGAAACLRHLIAEQRLLGIASNSQAYTRREMTAALRTAGLNLSCFDRDVHFWSYENGFSKPDPHVFRLLTARLEARGIAPSETLMVGDRRDNDIEPAQAFGWHTWQLTAASRDERAGNWRELLAWLQSSNR